MKTTFVGLALLIAAPALAQTAPAQLEKKECCCKEGEKKMDCCDKMKGDKGATADPHAGHDMSSKSQ